MSYLGDIHLGATVRKFYTTVNGSGVPTQLAGSPAAVVYENGDTAEITAGVTLTVDFDAKTGLNLIAVDTSQAGYERGKDYAIVISAGTVGGNSVANYVVAEFSIENRLGIVDQMFKRDLSAITGEALYSLINALRAARNKWTIVGTTLTYYEEDGTTVAFSGTITVNGTGEITSFTPSA